MYYSQPFVVERFFKTIEDVKAQSLGTDDIKQARAALQREMKKQKELVMSSLSVASVQLYLSQYIADVAMKQFLRVDIDAWTFDRKTPGLKERVEEAIRQEYAELLLEVADAQRLQEQQKLRKQLEDAEQEAKRVRDLELDLVEKFAERQFDRNRIVASDADERIESAQQNVSTLTSTVKDLAGVVFNQANAAATMYQNLLVPQIGVTAQTANQAAKEQLPSEREQRELRQRQQVFSRRVGCVVAAFIGVSGLGILVFFLIYLAMHAL